MIKRKIFGKYELEEYSDFKNAFEPFLWFPREMHLT